jgi:hypothetical protein
VGDEVMIGTTRGLVKGITPVLGSRESRLVLQIADRKTETSR